MLLLIIPFICPFFFLSNKTFRHRIIHSSYYSQSLQCCIHLESGQVYCGKENQDSMIEFCLLFPFSFFSISHSNVIHREICVNDFSGTTVPRILKFATNVEYDLLCKVESVCCCLSFPLFVHFSFSKHIFCYKFLSVYENQSLQICIHIESGQVY